MVFFQILQLLGLEKSWALESGVYSHRRILKELYWEMQCTHKSRIAATATKVYKK